MQLDRRTVAVLAIGVLGVLALALSAATLTDPTRTSGASVVGTEGNVTSLFDNRTREPPTARIPASISTFLRLALLAVLIVGVVIGIFLLDARDVGLIVAVSVLAAVVFWLLLRLAELFSGSAGSFGFGSPGSGFGGAGGLPSGGAGGVASPLLLGGVGLVAVLALIALLGFSTDASDSSSDRTVPERERDLESVGRAAGRAADAIEDDGVSTDNAVYRAWMEMTTALEVSDRQATTPGEFADAAIAAGMGRDDVEELTRLFEEVRYGDAPVDDERAERASAALRRIESTYAGDSE